MKILIPAVELADSFAHNVAHTLRAMGHDVLTAPESVGRRFSRVRRTAHDLWSRTTPNASTAAERWAVRAAKQFRPKMVLALTQQLTESNLEEFRRSGVLYRVGWWGDPPAVMKQLGLFTPGWDVLFFKDPGAVSMFRRVGFDAHHLHEAMNPDWHRPVATQSNNDVVAAGAWYSYRQALALRLASAGISIKGYGPRLPFWRLRGIERLHAGRYIVQEEKSRVFGEAFACLNSMNFAEGDCLNCRAFESAAAGALQLIEYRPAVDECFEVGKELLAFSTFEELLERIAWAKGSPREVSAIRAAAANRARSEHTYRHRLTRLLECLGESAGG